MAPTSTEALQFISGCHSKGMQSQGDGVPKKRIHSCASVVVSCVTPLTISLENFRSQLTLYLPLIGTLNHGKVISYPLGMHP